MLRLPRPRCWPPVAGVMPVDSLIHAAVVTRSGVARTRWSTALAAVRIGSFVPERGQVLDKPSQTPQTRPLASVAATPLATLTVALTGGFNDAPLRTRTTRGPNGTVARGRARSSRHGPRRLGDVFLQRFDQLLDEQRPPGLYRHEHLGQSERRRYLVGLSRYFHVLGLEHRAVHVRVRPVRVRSCRRDDSRIRLFRDPRFDRNLPGNVQGTQANVFRFDDSQRVSQRQRRR